MLSWLQVSFLILILKNCLVSSTLPDTLRVGCVFLESDTEVHDAFKKGVSYLKAQNLVNGTTIEFDIQYGKPHDFFHLYTKGCSEVNSQITSLFGPNDKNLDLMLDSISSNTGIPYMSTSPRPFLISGSEDSSQFTISLFPQQGHLLRMIKDLVEELKWTEISIIHDPLNGILEPSLLSETLQTLGPVSVNKVSVDLRAVFVKLRLRGARNIIIDTSVENLASVIQAALDTGMMTKAYSYIFTMLDMRSGNWSRLIYSEALILGFNIINTQKFDEFQEKYAVNSSSMSISLKTGLILDSVELFGRGLEAFDETGTEFTIPSASCGEGRKWEIGQELIDSFTSVSFDGLTGPISLSNGLRVKLFVEILKLRSSEFNVESTIISTIGNWSVGIDYEYEGLLIDNKEFLSNEKNMTNKTLIISSIGGSKCYMENENGEKMGYCVDLAEHISKQVGFRYKIKESSESQYGKLNEVTGQWDGLIGEIIRGEADIGLDALLISSSLSSSIDFSPPFLSSSLVLLYTHSPPPFSFEPHSLLVPFTNWVWCSIFISLLITSFALQLVGWLGRGRREEIIVAGSESETPSFVGRGLSIGNCLWILLSACVLRGTDIRLKAASSRTIALLWWLFSLVLIIIYVSFISHSLQPSVQNPLTIDTIIKNPKITIGLTESLSLELKNSKNPEVEKIWWKIQRGNLSETLISNIEEGIEKVRLLAGSFVLLADEKILNFYLSDDCSFGTIKNIESRSYGVAVQKGSVLREKISEAILKLKETGILSQLEEKWWSVPNCHDKISNKPQLNFENFIGLLTILAAGIIISIFIAMGERLVHHRRSHRGFFRTHAHEPKNEKISMNDTESE